MYIRSKIAGEVKFNPIIILSSMKWIKTDCPNISNGL